MYYNQKEFSAPYSAAMLNVVHHRAKYAASLLLTFVFIALGHSNLQRIIEVPIF
jgi:hypothetical protein